MRSPPPVASRSTTSGKNKWGPYSNSKDFYTNTAIVLLILISAAILAFLLHAALRFYLRWRRRRCLPNSSAETQKPTKEDATVAVVETLPEMLYSPATNLARGEAECAICLTEFAGGDRVRVLPACRHGFHVRCVDEWIAGRPSCPTCRAACRSAAGLPERRPEVA